MDIANIGDMNAATLRFNEMQLFPQVQWKCNDIHSNCSICIGDFNKDDIILILPCVHKFHKSCIHTWLSKKNTCPTCRETVIHITDEEIETEDEEEEEPAADYESDVEEVSDISSETMTHAELRNIINSIGDLTGDSSASDMEPEFISDWSSNSPISSSSSSSGITKIPQHDSDDSLHSIDSINSGSMNEISLESTSEDWY